MSNNNRNTNKTKPEQYLNKKMESMTEPHHRAARQCYLCSLEAAAPLLQELQVFDGGLLVLGGLQRADQMLELSSWLGFPTEGCEAQQRAFTTWSQEVMVRHGIYPSMAVSINQESLFVGVLIRRSLLFGLCRAPKFGNSRINATLKHPARCDLLPVAGSPPPNRHPRERSRALCRLHGIPNTG